MFWNRTWLLLVGVFLAFNLLLFNQDISLWDDDEAAYAGFAQQMRDSGDWVNPHFQWAGIHRKPPLHFWTVAVSFSIFGVNEFALRLPSVLAIWLTCASLWWFGRRLFGEDRAAWAATILASSLVIPLFAKMALTDATLLLFQTTAVLGLLNYVHQPHLRWNLLLWTSVALGVLAKGPPILILIGGLWVWLLILHPQRRNLLGTHPWLFLPIALLPLGIWMYLSWLRDEGRLLAFLYDWYLVRRIGGSVLGQTGPPGYHLVVLLLSFAAWLPFLWMAIGERIRTWRQPWSPNQIALAGWMVFGWLFFELMSSKSPSYALAAQPAWALAIAPQLCRRVPLFPRAFKAATVLQAVVWLGIVGALSISAYRLMGATSALVGGDLDHRGAGDRLLHGQAPLAVAPSRRRVGHRLCDVDVHDVDHGGGLGGGTFSHQGHQADGGDRLPVGEGIRDHPGVLHRPAHRTEEEEPAGVSVPSFSIASTSDAR